MTTRTSKHPVQMSSKSFASWVGGVPGLPAIMVIGALLVALGWTAVNSGRVTGNMWQMIITTLLVVALLPTTMGVVSGLFCWADPAWLTRNDFAGYGNSLDAAATVNLLLLFPENLNASNLPFRLEQLHRHAVKTIFVSPEPAVNATSIAAAIGADNFVAAIAPDSLLSFVEKSRANGLHMALGVTNTAYIPVLQHVDMPIIGRHAATSLREIVAVADAKSVIPRVVDLLELGQRWRITKQVIWNVAVISDLLKWIVVIPTLLPMLVGLNWLQLTSPLSAVTAALIYGGLTVLVCVPLVFFGAPNYFVRCKKISVACSLVTGFIGIVTIKSVEIMLVMWGLA